MANDADKMEAMKQARKKKKPAPPPDSRANENRSKLGVISPFSPDWPMYNPPPVKRA